MKSNQKVRNERSKEAVYSLAFWLFVGWYFAEALVTAWQRIGLPSLVITFTAFCCQLQLLRMHYYLHTFEEERTL